MDQLSRNDAIAVLVRVTIGAAVAFYSLKWLMNQMDPTSQNKKKARTKAESLIKRITETDKSLRIDLSTLSDYELVIATHLVVPEDINVSWSDIAGLDSVIQELRENVVLPIRHRSLYSSSQLWKAPSGMHSSDFDWTCFVSYFNMQFCCIMNCRCTLTWTPGVWKNFNRKSDSKRSWHAIH